MIRVWNAIVMIRDLAKIHRGIREKLTEYEVWLLPGSGIHHKLGTDAVLEKKRYFLDSDDRISGCGILVKKERECGTGTERDGTTFSRPWTILCFTTDSFDDKQINDCDLRFSQEQEQEQAVFVRA